MASLLYKSYKDFYLKVSRVIALKIFLLSYFKLLLEFIILNLLVIL